jgi:hypothetical protein
MHVNLYGGINEMSYQISLPPSVKTQSFNFRRFLSQHNAISRDITLPVPEVPREWRITIVLDKLTYVYNAVFRSATG